jgi:hypothetical protein
MSKQYYKKADGVSVENGILRKMLSGWGNGLVLLEPGVARGVHRWKFQAIEGKKATIGMCASDVSMDTYVNQTDRGWGYYQANGKKGTSGPAKAEYGVAYKTPGDIVEMEFDADRGTLSFWRNGTFMGVAFDNLPVDGSRRFYAAVSLFKAGAAIRIMSHTQVAASGGPSAPVGVAGGPAGGAAGAGGAAALQEPGAEAAPGGGGANNGGKSPAGLWHMAGKLLAGHAAAAGGSAGGGAAVASSSSSGGRVSSASSGALPAGGVAAGGDSSWARLAAVASAAAASNSGRVGGAAAGPVSLAEGAPGPGVAAAAAAAAAAGGGGAVGPAGAVAASGAGGGAAGGVVADACEPIRVLRYPQESVTVSADKYEQRFLLARKLVKGWDDGASWCCGDGDFLSPFQRCCCCCRRRCCR